MRHLKNAVLKGFHGNSLTHQCDSARRLPYRPAAAEALTADEQRRTHIASPYARGGDFFVGSGFFAGERLAVFFAFPVGNELLRGFAHGGQFIP